MLCNPVITGTGLQTPLGAGVQATWSALLDGRFVSDHARALSPNAAAGTPRVHHIALLAAQEALLDAGIAPDRLHGTEFPIVVGTSKGAIDEWLDRGSASMCGLADAADFVADALGVSGTRLTLSAACASGLHALWRAVQLIRSGEAERVLVVAAESSLHPLFIANFDRLGVLAPPGYGCRPFDKRRKGFVMSEAAAAVVIESSADRGYARIDRIALAGDATHLTSGDSDQRALRWALRQVIDPAGVDLIHTHGTGTQANDSAELSAIERVIPPDARASLYSHKGALGHSLGASGLVSVVLNCTCHEVGAVPGNVRTSDPVASTLAIGIAAQRKRVVRSIAMAAGFGGAIGAVSLTGR